MECCSKKFFPKCERSIGTFIMLEEASPCSKKVLINGFIVFSYPVCLHTLNAIWICSMLWEDLEMLMQIHFRLVHRNHFSLEFSHRTNNSWLRDVPYPHPLSTWGNWNHDPCTHYNMFRIINVQCRWDCANCTLKVLGFHRTSA